MSFNRNSFKVFAVVSSLLLSVPSFALSVVGGLGANSSAGAGAGGGPHNFASGASSGGEQNTGMYTEDTSDQSSQMANPSNSLAPSEIHVIEVPRDGSKR